ncbi:unnamed protein product, partial [Discosporangium mesarthrocarpum]
SCGKVGHGPTECPYVDTTPAGYSIIPGAGAFVATNVDNTGEYVGMVSPGRDHQLVPWVADSGAAMHMTNSSAGMSNYFPEAQGACVQTASGDLLPVLGNGDLGLVFVLDGSEFPATLLNVAHVPKLRYNLFSLDAFNASGIEYHSSASGFEVGGGLSFVRRPGQGYASVLAHLPSSQHRIADPNPG